MFFIGRKRFYFARLSAPIVAGFGCLLVLKIAAYLFPQGFAAHAIFDAAAFSTIALFAAGLSMYLWGRLLVLCGIINDDEGSGHPYSRPWEKHHG